jgi:predicted Zn-dependent protease
MTDADPRDYVQLVGKRLGDAARLVDPNRTRDTLFSNIAFHLVACDVPNVITTGGAHFYIFNGLFQICHREDELAAAISHAYAHAISLDMEHIDLRPDANMPLPLVGWELATHRYTNSQEQAADRLAFEIYLKAGYDPQKFTTVFQVLADRYANVQLPDRTPLLIRIQDARTWGAPVETAANRPLPVADPRTFEALRRQASALKADQAPALSRVILLALPNCMLSGDLPEQDAARQQLRPEPPAKRLEPS